MRLVPMELLSSTDTFQIQTMLTKSSRLSNSFNGHILMMPSLKDSKRLEHLLTATGYIINPGDDRLETQPTPPPQHMDKVLNDTYLMMKHTLLLVDTNKWCNNKVDTCDVHCALKPLHGSQ